MKRVLGVATSILAIGSLVVIVSFLTHQSQDTKIAAAIVGFACTACGALIAIVGMHVLLRDESYIAARTDGVMLSSRGREHFIAWDHLHNVRYELRMFVFECEAGEIAFEDETPNPTPIVKMINQLRLRAHMGLPLSGRHG